MRRVPLPTPDEVSTILQALLATPEVRAVLDGTTLSDVLHTPNPDEDGPTEPYLRRQLARAARVAQRLSGPRPEGRRGRAYPFCPLVSRGGDRVTWTVQTQVAHEAIDHTVDAERAADGTWRVVGLVST